MSDSKINSSHTSFMNFTHNPHLVKNNQSYNFSNTANNTMTRNYSRTTKTSTSSKDENE